MHVNKYNNKFLKCVGHEEFWDQDIRNTAVHIARRPANISGNMLPEGASSILILASCDPSLKLTPYEAAQAMLGMDVSCAAKGLGGTGRNQTRGHYSWCFSISPAQKPHLLLATVVLPGR